MFESYVTFSVAAMCLPRETRSIALECRAVLLLHSEVMQRNTFLKVINEQSLRSGEEFGGCPQLSTRERERGVTEAERLPSGVPVSHPLLQLAW